MRLDIEYYDGYYFIILCGNNIRLVYDFEIAHKIGISFDQYQKELLNFGGNLKYDEVNFAYYEEINNALKYLKNKYDVILALMN